ncbi:hypothetical protein LSAT2_026051 [Lamellibrachia satsuma]|nr:hypothetical protein LSAT2_026051 [Lamellibrachia satsuma]
MIALQTQVKLLDWRQETLTDENIKLRHKIAAIEAAFKAGLNDDMENGIVYSCKFVKKRDDTAQPAYNVGNLRQISPHMLVLSKAAAYLPYSSMHCACRHAALSSNERNRWKRNNPLIYATSDLKKQT